MLLSINNGPYTDYGTYRNADIVGSGNGSYLSTLTDPSGIIAKHVTGICFVIMNPDQGYGPGAVGGIQAGSSGGTVVHELQAFGTPSTSPTTYASWSGTTYGLSGADALPDSDPNHNGVKNLVEYALGGDPVATRSAGYLPVSQTVSSHERLSFTRYLDRTDLTLTVQASDDLTNWTALATSVAGAPFTVVAGGTAIAETGAGMSRSMAVTDPVAMTDPAHPKRFARLQVTKQATPTKKPGRSERGGLVFNTVAAVSNRHASDRQERPGTAIPTAFIPSQGASGSGLSIRLPVLRGSCQSIPSRARACSPCGWRGSPSGSGPCHGFSPPSRGSWP